MNTNNSEQAALNSDTSPRLRVKWLIREEQIDQIVNLESAKSLLPFGVYLVIVDGLTIWNYKELLELIGKKFSNNDFIDVMIVRGDPGG